MDIIKKLNAMRLERNMSVYRLAELSGVNQSTLANTFSRGVIPSIANLEAACTAMGVTLSQFFNENEKEFFLTEDETEMLLSFRKLPFQVKNTVSKMIKSVAETQ